MTRLFAEHFTRKVTSLNGGWRLMPDHENKGLENGWHKGLPAEARTVIVPGVWNSEPDLFHHFGVCWYEKDIVTGERSMIEFGAVACDAKVYLDGEELGSHYGGFSAFRVFADTAPGAHKLVVRVDASSNSQTIPLPYVDWYHYGGIIRDVELSDLGAAYIENIHYDYKLAEDMKSADLSAIITVRAFEAVKTPVTIYFEGEEYGKTEIDIHEAGTETFTMTAKINDIKLWDIYAGNLYGVRVATCCDDLCDRIGFRKIEVQGQKILLNGREIFLKGVNRHEEHPDWGFAVPPQINKRDVDIIKGMHCNTVRGSHYPNSKVFLDMLDEAGILFWSEIPMWGFPADRMADPVVLQRGLTMHEEMTEQYFNHPSIVLWGLNNECATNCDEGYALCKAYADHLRANGGNRLITFASNVIEWDICLDLVDVVSLNKYIGWYGEPVEGWDKFIPWLRRRVTDAGVPDKPIVLSEYGTAGLYGYTSFDGNKWTEEYQAMLLKKVTELCIEEPGIVGTYVWQYCDIRSENELNRARSFNNKGIVNEFRRPKLAYYAMKEIYGKLPD